MDSPRIAISSIKRNHEYFFGLVEQILEGLRMEAALRHCLNLECDIQGLIDRLRARPDQTAAPTTVEEFFDAHS